MLPISNMELYTFAVGGPLSGRLLSRDTDLGSGIVPIRCGGLQSGGMLSHATDLKFGIIPIRGGVYTLGVYCLVLPI